MTKTKTFKIDIWDLINIEDVNAKLDEAMSDGGNVMATDISYEAESIFKNGELTLKATYTPEEM